MLLTRVALAIVSKSSIVSSLVHQSENRMMYYPDQTFFGHNATGCINPKRLSHELHEFHEFSFVEFVRGEFLRRVSPGVPRKTGGSPDHGIYGTGDLGCSDGADLGSTILRRLRSFESKKSKRRRPSFLESVMNFCLLGKTCSTVSK